MKIFLAIVIFLFGTTFWWMSSFMTGQAETPRQWSWTLTNALVVLSVVACTVTAWAILQRHGWWTSAAVVSGVVGLLAVGAFILAQRTLDVGFRDLGVQINLWMHLVGSVMLIGIALLPSLRSWVAEIP